MARSCRAWTPTTRPPPQLWQFPSAHPADLRPSLELPPRKMLEAPVPSASSSPLILAGGISHILSTYRKSWEAKGSLSPFTLLPEHPSHYSHCLAVALSAPLH